MTRFPRLRVQIQQVGQVGPLAQTSGKKSKCHLNPTHAEPGYRLNNCLLHINTAFRFLQTLEVHEVEIYFERYRIRNSL